jgi:hydroxymethylbilane synthase
MGRRMRLRISARQSDLARLQAYRVGEALAKSGGHQIEYNFRASLGDINQHDPLWKMPEKGVFTEDFLRDLIEGTAEMVVHSWKDLPTHLRPETEIAATLPRADLRDVLLFRRDREDAVRTNRRVRILTSSPRRSHNLRSFLADHLPFELESVEFEPVRGNIPTRLKKLLSQDVDGLIVAKAALDRLISAGEAEFAETQAVIRTTLEATRFMVLPLSVNPTAAAQGALAIEISKARPDVREALQAINCPETFACVEKERRILASHGGGCHQKIGVSVLRRPFGEITYVRGLTDAGVVLDQIKLEGSSSGAAKAQGPVELFPRTGEEGSFFKRERLPRSEWQEAERAPHLWVARETALPEDFVVHSTQIVWAAGLRTWQKLAARGIWVHGTAEGLGEHEPTRLEALLGLEKVEWLKLTHDSSATLAQGAGLRTIATYRLVARDGTSEEASEATPDLRDRTHFFWMSASQFEQALKLYPEIRDRHHASGPGLTHEFLRHSLGEKAQLEVYLDIEAWRAHLQHSTGLKPPVKGQNA